MLASAHCLLIVIGLLLSIASLVSGRIPLAVAVLLLAIAELLGCAMR